MTVSTLIWGYQFCTNCTLASCLVSVCSSGNLKKKQKNVDKEKKLVLCIRYLDNANYYFPPFCCSTPALFLTSCNRSLPLLLYIQSIFLSLVCYLSTSLSSTFSPLSWLSVSSSPRCAELLGSCIKYCRSKFKSWQHLTKRCMSWHSLLWTMRVKGSECFELLHECPQTIPFNSR